MIEISLDRFVKDCDQVEINKLTNYISLNEIVRTFGKEKCIKINEKEMIVIRENAILLYRINKI